MIFFINKKSKPIKRKLTWKPQFHDHRDFQLKLTPPAKLPAYVDLRSYCPPVYDQGELGSCTANAIAFAYEFEKIKQKQPHFTPSRLFIYYNERVIENTVNEDSGAQIRDGIKSVVSQGVCPESEWTYNIKKFAKKPPKRCYTHALHHEVKQYLAVTQTPDQLRGCLAAGYPIIFGFTVYSSFMGDDIAANGIMTMPQSGDSIDGGHAVAAVGYNDKTKRYIVRNSWNTTWGDKGYFYMPYDYMHSRLSSDFWTIRMVE